MGKLQKLVVFTALLGACNSSTPARTAADPMPPTSTSAPTTADSPPSSPPAPSDAPDAAAPPPAPTPTTASTASTVSPEMAEWISVVRLKDHKPGAPPKTITTELEAIDFALAQPDMKKKVKPLETWWGKAQKHAPEHPKRWFISFGQGDNACNTEYQCVVQVESDGTIARPFECTGGWNCK